MYNSVVSVIDKLRKSNSTIKYSTIIIIIIILGIPKTNLEIYVLLENVTMVASVIAFIYVNIIRAKFVDKTFLKSFEIKYLVLSAIALVNFIGFISLIESIPTIYLFLLCSIDTSLEYCIIASILKFKRNYLITITSFMFYIGIFIVKFFMFREREELLFIRESFIVSISLSVVIAIIILRNIIKNKMNFSTESFKNIISYVISIMANYIFLISYSYGELKITKIAILVKSILAYKFYNYITSKVLDNSLIKINNNIETATKTKKELNEILVKRNIILNEANIMLKRSGDKNNRLIDSIYGAIFLFYSNKLQYVNKGTMGILNISTDELLGIDLHEFINKYFDITLEDIEKAQNYIPCINMNVNDLEVEVFLNQIDKNNKILYIHDISEINENNKMRKAWEEYLEEEETKTEFFSNISHELRTPVNLIFSALQMNQIYLRENNEENVEGVDRNRRVIKQNCLRLIRTINNFIDANKISEGYVHPDLRTYNIVEIIESTSIATNKYIQLIDNLLIFDADQEEIYVRCDKEMIIRIMLNILSNSVKYGKNGGNINVSIKSIASNNVVIKVQNDGVIIDKNTIPYIFEKFTKLNKAFNRLKEGSGLGLFLTKALIELQDGNIKLESTDKGNEFTITFPMVEKPEHNEFIHDHWNISPLEEKVDIEFSDIYIE